MAGRTIEMDDETATRIGNVVSFVERTFMGRQAIGIVPPSADSFARDSRVVAVKVVSLQSANANLYNGLIVRRVSDTCSGWPNFFDDVSTPCYIYINEDDVGGIILGRTIVNALVVGMKAVGSGTTEIPICLHSMLCADTESGPISGSGAHCQSENRTYISSITPAGTAGYYVTYTTENSRRCTVSQWTTLLPCCCDCGSSTGSTGSIPETCTCNIPDGSPIVPVCSCWPDSLCITIDAPFVSTYRPCDVLLDNTQFTVDIDSFAAPCAGANVGRPNEDYLAGWSVDVSVTRVVQPNGIPSTHRLVGIVVCWDKLYFIGKLIVTNCPEYGGDVTVLYGTDGGAIIGFNPDGFPATWPVVSVGTEIPQDQDSILISCNDPFTMFIAMNNIRLILSNAPCTSTTKYFCVTPNGSGTKQCMGFDTPPGPNPTLYIIHGGPYDTADMCVNACLVVPESKWYCMGDKCIQSTIPPEGYVSGPFDSLAECGAACGVFLYYCVVGFAGNSCVYTDDPSGYTVVAGPFAMEGECNAACA